MAQSLITSETQQWLTRNWERHDHWPLFLELCITMKGDPNERLERTQRQWGQHFGSFLKLNHLTLFTWSKRDKEFSHEESQDEQSSSRSLLQSDLLPAFEFCRVDQTFSSSPAMLYPADFWGSVFKESRKTFLSWSSCGSLETSPAELSLAWPGPLLLTFTSNC